MTLFYLLVLAFFQFCRAQNEVCDDVDYEICASLNSTVHNMCGDQCLAGLCKRFCGQCPLKCYKCTGIDQPENCNITMTCPSTDHYCAITQTFDENFSKTFKMGCALNNVCASSFDESLFVIGKRSKGMEEFRRSGTHIDGGCCHEDLCNNKSPVDMEVVMVNSYPSTLIPATTGQSASPSVSTCTDISSAICDKLYNVLPNMCQTDCIANRICPQKCGKCFECYNCSHVLAPEQCNQTTVCQSGQECFVLETLSTMTFQHGYHLGCMDKHVCSQFYTEVQGPNGNKRDIEVSVQGECCQSNLCNNHMVTTTTSTTTTTTSTTTTTPKPTPKPTAYVPNVNNYPDCPTHYKHCPDSYDYDSSTRSCYRVIDKPMTWQQGKEYCRRSCADLADLDGHGETGYIAQLIQMGAIQLPGGSLSGNNAVYVDATSVTGSWKWNATGVHIPLNVMGYAHSSPYKCGVLIIPAAYEHIGRNYLYMAEVRCNAHQWILCEIKNVSHA